MKKKEYKAFAVIRGKFLISSPTEQIQTYRSRVAAEHEWREIPKDEYEIVPCTITY